MGMVTNMPGFEAQIKLSMSKVRTAYANLYREAVWLIFERIVLTTPQYSGKAVANWMVGAGAPDMTWDNAAGDYGLTMPGAKHESKYQKGDREWANRALDRARPIIAALKNGQRVYITNNVQGEDGAYLEAMQTIGSTAYNRLRVVNLPYETAQVSAMLMAREFEAGVGANPLSKATQGFTV